MTEEEQFYLMKKYVKSIDDPCEEVQMRIINSNVEFIEYIKNPTIEVQKIAIINNGFKWIKNPSKEIMLFAVEKNPHNIHYIQNPDKNIQLAAVRQSVMSLRWIYNPYQETIKEAFDSSWESIFYININLLSKDLKLKAIRDSKYNITVINYVLDICTAMEDTCINHTDIHWNSFEPYKEEILTNLIIKKIIK